MESTASPSRVVGQAAVGCGRCVIAHWSGVALMKQYSSGDSRAIEPLRLGIVRHIRQSFYSGTIARQRWPAANSGGELRLESSVRRNLVTDDRIEARFLNPAISKASFLFRRSRGVKAKQKELWTLEAASSATSWASLGKLCWIITTFYGGVSGCWSWRLSKCDRTSLEAF
jgi:hypothetical protein